MIKIIKQASYILIISVILGLLVNAFSSNPLSFFRPLDKRETEYPQLSADEVMKHIEEGSAIIVDAREAKYYEEGRLPSAINLPAHQFGEYFADIGESLPQDYPMIIYCQGSPCDESLDVLENLKLLEFEKLNLYPGGWTEWINKGFMVESDQTP
jgi:rhodanese-related sulfurtransferase